MNFYLGMFKRRPKEDNIGWAEVDKFRFIKLFKAEDDERARTKFVRELIPDNNSVYEYKAEWLYKLATGKNLI
jgi:hypothetical protein